MGHRRTIVVAVLALMTSGARSLADDKASLIAFLRARDVAWRSQVPTRLSIEELHTIRHPDEDELWLQVTRHTWIWDGKIQYSALQSKRDGRGRLAPRYKQYAAYNGKQWFYAATEAGGTARGWRARVAKKNPNADWKTAIWTQWMWPIAGTTLEARLVADHVQAVYRRGGEIVLYLAPDAEVIGHYARDRRLGGFAATKIVLAEKRDWRPVRVEFLFTESNVERRPDQEAVPKDRVDGLSVQVNTRVEFDEWKAVRDVWLPTRIVKTVIVDPVRNVVSGNILAWECAVEPIDAVPSSVTFMALPPPDFGSTGVVVDDVRGVTEHVEMGSRGALNARREEIVTEMSKWAPKERTSRVRRVAGVVACILLASLLIAWRIRRSS